MLNQSGFNNGVLWSVIYKGEKVFELTVGEKVENYRCIYEPIFGIDVLDNQNINLQLDKMQGLN